MIFTVGCIVPIPVLYLWSTAQPTVILANFWIH